MSLPTSMPLPPWSKHSPAWPVVRPHGHSPSQPGPKDLRPCVPSSCDPTAPGASCARRCTRHERSIPGHCLARCPLGQPIPGHRTAQVPALGTAPMAQPEPGQSPGIIPRAQLQERPIQPCSHTRSWRLQQGLGPPHATPKAAPQSGQWEKALM